MFVFLQKRACEHSPQIRCARRIRTAFCQQFFCRVRVQLVQIRINRQLKRVIESWVFNVQQPNTPLVEHERMIFEFDTSHHPLRLFQAFTDNLMLPSRVALLFRHIILGTYVLATLPRFKLASVHSVNLTHPQFAPVFRHAERSQF